MKNIYMICNAHLDPVWQWQKTEGMAEAISTFRVAADFCEKYDGFVFNHNESVLYEWVEENDPKLFERIKRLVKEGKWRIMGGWYLQPDCLMPSGESIIRQIEVGNRYFTEKFGVKPNTAINFDPFGHSRGMVQILKQHGYDSYIFMRPNNFCPERDFLWRGYDGSEIIGHSSNGAYNSGRGQIDKKLDSFLENSHDGNNLMLWGIGDHGGGPSEIDLQLIEKYKKEHPDIKLIHSYCEEYFKTVDVSKLKTVDTSAVHCMIGCYTSMVKIKQQHRLLENMLNMCEGMLALSKVDYDKSKMEEAEKALLFSEFHDILPGSSTKKVEEDALYLMGFGKEILSRYISKAFFAMCAGEKKSENGRIPLLVYNPLPYEVKEIVEVEFQLEDQNWKDEYTLSIVYDENGNRLPSQSEKAEANISLDWRKRVAFCATLKPMSINRFNCELKSVEGRERPIDLCDETDTHFIFSNDVMRVKINKETGLLDEYISGGINYLNKSGMKIVAYRDNEDPWGMEVDGYYDILGEFKALNKQEANAFNGYPKREYESVRIIENGEVLLKIQALMKYSNSYAVVTYTIPKQFGYVDVSIKMLTNDVNTAFKLRFDTALEKDAKFIGQQMFGREEMHKAEKEAVYQKWCGLFGDKKGLSVLNRGTYGGSADGNILNITLLRTSVYLAHPIPNRPLVEENRFHEHIDMGERDFEFRITTDVNHIDAAAEEFSISPFALSFFPDGEGENKVNQLSIQNKDIVLSRCTTDDNGKLLLRMYNTLDVPAKSEITVGEKKSVVEFASFEIKTLLF